MSFVAIEVKSFGCFIEVVRTKRSELQIDPSWMELFNIELHYVESLRAIMYCEVGGMSIVLGNQEFKIDPNDFSVAKTISLKFSENIQLYMTLKFLSPKKTITRRRTKNKNEVFGCSLSDLLKKEKSSIPQIVKDCVEVVETRGIEEVGIYRVSAAINDVQRLKDIYSKSKNKKKH